MKTIRKPRPLPRTEQIEFLLAACHRLMLEPRDAKARSMAMILLMTGDLSAETGDSRLVACLIKEARAHADELAFRLDSGGASSLHVGAMAARLCQSVTALQAQIASRRPAEMGKRSVEPEAHRLQGRFPNGLHHSLE